MKIARRATWNVAILLTIAAWPATARQTAIRLSPEQAIINSAEVRAGVSGVFEMVVRSTGRRDGLLYLNSQADYRDQRNLVVVISPAVEQSLQSRFGAAVEPAVLRHAIAVRGTARRTRIDFLHDGRPTGAYYYQTHLVVRSDRDLTVSGEHPLE